MARDNEDEDDYLTMTLAEPTPTKRESLTETRKRKAREAELRGRPKSKAQLAEEERTKREAALATSTLDAENKGFKMMAKLGYKPGSALGANVSNLDANGATIEPLGARLLEPLGLEMKEGRAGIGADAEEKRKIREEWGQVDQEQKKRKVDAGQYRDRQARERQEKRMEGQFFGAQKVAEQLDEGDSTGEQLLQPDDGDASHRDPERLDMLYKKKKPSGNKRLKNINLLWRGLVKQRMASERDKRMRYDLHQSLSRLPTYDDPDEDQEDKMALAKKSVIEEIEIDLDEEDEELESFEALTISEKLSKIVEHLREHWHYCFWCKYRYPDESMEGCPGTTEDDHG